MRICGCQYLLSVCMLHWCLQFVLCSCSFRVLTSATTLGSIATSGCQTPSRYNENTRSFTNSLDSSWYVRTCDCTLCFNGIFLSFSVRRRDQACVDDYFSSAREDAVCRTMSSYWRIILRESTLPIWYAQKKHFSAFWLLQKSSFSVIYSLFLLSFSLYPNSMTSTHVLSVRLSRADIVHCHALPVFGIRTGTRDSDQLPQS